MYFFFVRVNPKSDKEEKPPCCHQHPLINDHSVNNPRSRATGDSEPSGPNKVKVQSGKH